MKRVISLILLAVMFFAGLANVDFFVVFAEEQTENLRINVKSPTNGRFFCAKFARASCALCA
ncbi:MAG TPA: hypothetical protein DEQ88_01090 [Clostridiales bacterium]|nr:hypothetical protein [Clostridiales bacterium]